ncbi:MAG TPA: sugar ABC transporter ATP-binding protein [Solirubrobacterales bacterium]|nr:sugar ABC transporter ATP-binding protein [Solirubrobacterales bacterium]
MSQPLVRLRSVRKSFGANVVLDDVNLELNGGEAHALIGENGAGKSTLGKIVGGVYRADAGVVEIDGHPMRGRSPREALHLGVATIQQELSLLPERTVAENVFLGIERNRAGFLLGRASKRFDQLEETVQMGLEPDRLVGDLRIADQQKVEIMRALARDARVIIMDEPTSSLTADEVERLHQVIARLRGQGKLIVYVTHFLRAVLATCDRVTILRDGVQVRTDATSEESEESLVESMLGQPSDVAFPAPSPVPAHSGPPRLKLHELRTDTGLDGVSLHIDPGEIVGLAGLVGAGRTELARAIYGADRLTSGEMEIDGEPYAPRSVRGAISRGIVFIPEDRKREGLIFTTNVQRNIGLPVSGRVRHMGLLSDRRERQVAEGMVDRLNIVPNDVGHEIGTLSGGNQQKVLFAKWMTVSPRLVLLDEPTRGVDVGSRMHIYALIHQLARAGAGVLLISSELEEVLGLSHRAYVIREGRTTHEVASAETSAEEVLYTIFGLQRNTKGKEQAR